MQNTLNETFERDFTENLFEELSNKFLKIQHFLKRQSLYFSSPNVFLIHFDKHFEPPDFPNRACHKFIRYSGEYFEKIRHMQFDILVMLVVLMVRDIPSYLCKLKQMTFFGSYIATSYVTYSCFRFQRALGSLKDDCLPKTITEESQSFTANIRRGSFLSDGLKALLHVCTSFITNLPFYSNVNIHL